MASYEIDMCHGPLFGKIVRFALPLMATYILQLLFNAADLVVIGNYEHPDAMAAIGCTMSMNSLILNVFGGLSIGTNVVAARMFGEKRFDRMPDVVGTSILLALVGGLVLTVCGLLVARPLLILMKTPADILPLSCKYIEICFAAIPFIMLYNFGCAVLRAVGDTRRPLYFLVVAGIVNVVLNWILVALFEKGVAGVAWATAASHVVAAVLILITLIRTPESYRLHWKKLQWNSEIMREILKIGVPAGIQSSCFSVSNMTIQSTVNSFGPLVMAGNTAALGLEGIVYVGSFAFHQTAISFVAQNLGGGKFKRILACMGWCYLCSAVVCSVMALSFYWCGTSLLGLFNPNPEVIQWGMVRLKILFTTYALCGLMDTASGGMRGLGYSATSTIVSLMGACVFRIWWVFVVFPHYPTLEGLFLSYPVSWGLVALVNSCILWIVYRRLLYHRCRIRPPWAGIRPGMLRGLRYLVNPK